MKCLIIFILFLCHQKSISQDTLSEKKQIDSILIHMKINHKNFHKRNDSLYFRCSYNKKSKELIGVEELPDPYKVGKFLDLWIYHWYFIDGKLSLITKWNNTSKDAKNRKIAFYYFKNEHLIYKDESTTYIEDIELQKKKGEELRRKYSKVLH